MIIFCSYYYTDDNVEQFCLGCRMEYGKENKLVAARTDGKPAQREPSLDLRNGLSVLAPSRDHPRIVAGPAELMRIYGANSDLQLVLVPKLDVENLEDKSTVIEWALREVSRFKELADNLKEIEVELYNNRKYMNVDSCLNVLKDYVAGYCCKGEKSPKDAVLMLKTILINAPSGATTFSNIFHKLTQKLLSSRTVVQPEACFLLSELGSYFSSFTFQNGSLNVGRRVIDIPEAVADDNNDLSIVKLNMWDKYLKFQKESVPEVRVSYYNFIQEQGHGNNVVPVISYAYTHPTWPLDEEFSRTTLMLHNKYIMKLEDVKGDYPTYSLALHQFITDNGNDLPTGVIKSIQRAVKHSLKSNKMNPNKNNDAPILHNRQRGQRLHERDIGDGNGDLYGLSQDENNQEENDFNDVYGRNIDNNENIDDIGLLDTDIHEAESDYIDNTIIRSHWPSFDDLYTWLDKTIDDFNIINETDKIFSLPQFIDQREDSPTFEQLLYFDPSMAMNNEGQRTLLTDNIRFWRTYLEWIENPIGNQPILRAIVSGEAGTGKTYCIKILLAIVSMLFGIINTALLLAPTAIAAAACGGEVPDKALGFKRNDKVFKDIDVDTLTRLQSKCENLKLVVRDEMSIEGQLIQV
jgi:hypothetical protein